MIPLLAQLTNNLTTRPVDLAPFREIRSRINGWSTEAHWCFFRNLVELPVSSILVCGVYHGMDLALLSRAIQDSGRSGVRLTGVDLFSAEPCADWTPEQRKAGSWQAAVNAEPPSMEIAASNAPLAQLHRSDSVSFMQTTNERFDVIYLDTSHDKETVRREIYSARNRLKPGGLLCGDDYSGSGGEGWGVDRAVQSMLPNHILLFNRIWASQ